MPKQGYHHGNLRAALIEAALRLIVDQGPRGFSLSDAARAAGVTPAAVYRHFAGRDDLIRECARQGHAIFADAMAAAYDHGRPGALRAFEATGRAYLDFARSHPGHYVAMFESGVAVNHDPDLAQVAARSRAVMETAAAALARRLPEARRPPVAMVAAHVWAMSHGVVELYARGAPGSQGPYPPEDLLETGIGIYLRGLGLLPPEG